jgi:hypothetical protein
MRSLEQNQRNKLYVIGAGLVALFIFYQIVVALSRAGETKVRLVVVPNDSTVSVNNKVVKGRTLYLGQGEYTFSAKKDGWNTDTQSVHVGKEAVQVGLIPDPASEQAQQFLKDNPDVQLQREAVGGLRANTKGEELRGNNPIINSLPYTQESPPFTIDYGLSQERKGDVFLIVSDSSPNGREAAVDWIRQQGLDPTNVDITFSGFVNPLSNAKVNAD